MAERYVPRVAQAVMVLLGPLNGETVLRNYGSQIVQWTYWWAVPFAQFALALSVGRFQLIVVGGRRRMESA